ncbi:hypothetical protein G7085_01160 [Tessaracoccus sp. HDW20]|nr:hypothetical protein [Tessaracoccus coleopterorum]
MLNDLEARAFTGLEDPAAAARLLAERVPLVIVTRGADGMVAADGSTGAEAVVPAFAVTPLNTTGAGDSTLAAFAFAHRIPGASLEDRLNLSAFIASAVLASPPGRGLPVPRRAPPQRHPRHRPTSCADRRTPGRKSMKPFSILVIGDTQYLFDGARKRPGFLLDTFRHASALAGTGAVAPIRHVIHVGDVTEHGWADEAEAAESVLQAGAALLRGTGMTIATGNHDIAQYSDDTRGETDFSRVFGPASRCSGKWRACPPARARRVLLLAGGRDGRRRIHRRPRP